MEIIEAAEREERQGGREGGTLGELGSAEGLPLNSTSAQLEASRVVKAGAGTLFSFTVLNTNIAARFVLVFDTGSPLTAASVPVVVVSVPAASSFVWAPGARGRAFYQGIVLANSTTPAVLTIGAADSWFDAQYA